MPASTTTVTEPSTGRPPCHGRWTLWLILVVASLIVSVAPLAKRRHFTCAICGMSRQTLFMLSIPIRETRADTNCSRWYRETVEPRHDHLWVRDTWSETCSVLGFRLFASNIAGHADGPLVRFGTDLRHLMYQRCSDPEVARDAFIRLSRWGTEGTAEREEQIAVEMALAEWEDSGLTGPWPLSGQ